MLPAKPDLGEGSQLMPPDHTPIVSRFHERVLGVLIWCAFAAVGITALYRCSLIMGD
jgi:hypothetical protein